MLETIRSIKEKIAEEFRRQFERDQKYLYLHELLQCFEKSEKEKEKGVLLDTNEVIDGILTEEILSRYGNFERNKLVISDLKVEGKTVAFHADLWGNGFSAEVKTPTFIYPKEKLPVEGEIYEDLSAFDIPKHYILQARAQAYILKRQNPDWKHFLVVKTTTKVFVPVQNRVRFKKVWIVGEVQPLSDQEWNLLVEFYKQKKTPLWSWECRYCPFKDSCKDGEAEEDFSDKELVEIKELYTKYLLLKEALENVERQLKRTLSGRSVFLNSKEIGYVTRLKASYDWERIKEIIPPEELLEFFQPDWRKYPRLEEKLKEKGFKPEEFKTLKEVKVFKL